MINNLSQALQMIKGNPMQMLEKFNIPQNIANDPNAVIQHLMNSGRITQDQYNKAVRMAEQLGIKR